MTTSKDKLIEDVAFIFEECARLNTMVNERRFAEIPREDGFCDLPHPTHNWPHGKMMCSRAGYRRLERLAQLSLKRAKLQRRITLGSARDALAEILVRKFVREVRPIEVKHVERAMSEAAKRVEATTGDLTHFVPCHLMLSQNPNEFRLGPIRFLNRLSFRKVLADHLRANRSTDHRMNRKVIFDAIRYFKTFGWVAEVTIVGCDKKVSSTARACRAQRCIARSTKGLSPRR
jgi:hypothetical protein